MINPTQAFRAIVFRSTSASPQVVILITRVIVGLGFIEHGYAKLMNGPEHFASSLAGLSVPAPEIMSWVTIAVELVTGSAVLIGAFVPLMCVPMVVILLVAMVYVHLPFGFSSIKLQAVTADGIKFGSPGYEVILLYLACIATLVVLGAGPVSIDSWAQKRMELKEGRKR